MYALTPSQWYFRYSCEGCKSQQVLFGDLSNGTSEIKATYGVACSDCGHEGSYESEQIERYQHTAVLS